MSPNSTLSGITPPAAGSATSASASTICCARPRPPTGCRAQASTAGRAVKKRRATTRRRGWSWAKVDFVEQFAADGWLKLGNLFDPKLIDAVREEFERQFDELAEHKGGFRSYINVGDRRMMLPVRLTGALADPQVY